MSLYSFLSRLLGRAKVPRRYFPKPLMSPSELAFFTKLQAAVPEYRVFPQICMGALIDPAAHLVGEARSRARHKYQSKMVDFTVWDPVREAVVCLVELDDPTHDNRRRHDEARDDMTREAGYATLRFDVRSRTSNEKIRAGILRAAQLKGAVGRPPRYTLAARQAGLFVAATFMVGLLWIAYVCLVADALNVSRLLPAYREARQVSSSTSETPWRG